MDPSLLNVTQQIDTGAIRIADNPRRIETIEDTNAAIAMPTGAQRDKSLQRAANSIIDLSDRERQMRKAASVNLLQAAEIGNTLIGLSRNYDLVSLRDVLNALNDSLTLAGSISPGVEINQECPGTAAGCDQGIGGSRSCIEITARAADYAE